MHILAIFLLLIGSGESSAVTGNPMRQFTDEQQIKLVITRLEQALLNKEEALITACLSDRVSSRDAKEVKANFAAHVANAQIVEGKPLVYLRTFEVDVDGNKAQVKIEAFSYGNGKRIQAIHKIPFRKGEYGWGIDKAESVNALLKQIGGIAPVQLLETPEVIDGRTIPIDAVQKGIRSAVPKVKVIPADAEKETTNETEEPAETDTNSGAAQ